MSEKFEGDAFRDWAGVEAVDDDLEERRRWVVWGVGGRPDVLRDAPAGNELAETIARSRDPGWEKELGERWIVVVHDDEDVVDEIVQDQASARGYAAYLVDGKPEEMPDEPMRGTLRDDVGPRRKVNQPRPYE